MSTTEPTSPTARTRVRRVAHRGHYDRTTLHAILDEAYVCHIAFADEHGVHCIPTACWREGDHLYIHGSNGSRMLKLAGSGAQVCVTITHIDGLVLARSAFNHSMNYRSAVIRGRARHVTDEAERRRALDLIVDHAVPGRADTLRAPLRKELAATTVLALPLHEASVKTRTGGPVDDEADVTAGGWAGEVALAVRAVEVRPDQFAAGCDVPADVHDVIARFT